jgi:hypothetical protein
VQEIPLETLSRHAYLAVDEPGDLHGLGERSIRLQKGRDLEVRLSFLCLAEVFSSNRVLRLVVSYFLISTFERTVGTGGHA